MSDETRRLSDGREDLGDEFAHGPDHTQRELGDQFARANADDAQRLGEEFADTDNADRHKVAEAYADPNSLDDRRIGKAFEQTNSSAKKRHKPIAEVVKKPTGHAIWRFLLGVVVLFLLVLLLGWLPRHRRNKETEERAKAAQSEKVSIEVVKVSAASNGSGLVVPGTTTPLVEAYVYGRANGYLKRRLVDIGDHVHEGQLLAIIDAPDLDQQVDQAREQLKQAMAQKAQQETQLALTRITTERYRALVTRGVFSRQDGDQREADYQAAVANVAAADRNVEAYRANLQRQIALQSYERVTSPFNGVITQRNVDVGALIQASGAGGGPSPAPTNQPGTGTQAGATNTSGSSGNASTLATPATAGGQGGPLFSIAAVNKLRILVSVPEGYASEVHAGQHTTIAFQEFPQRSFHGDVTRTASSIDQNSRTLLVEVQVDNQGGLLMAGMYAVVTFGAATGPGPLVIPGDAVAIRKDRPTVAVVKDGRIHLVPIEIGRDYGSVMEVVGGLKAGDMIATTFNDDVRENAEVKVVESKAQEDKMHPPAPPKQATPPGGSTQYGDPGITDQDMQGQLGKPQQKNGQGGQSKSSGSKGSKP